MYFWESVAPNNGTGFLGLRHVVYASRYRKAGDFLQRGVMDLAPEPWAQMMFLSEDRGAPMNYYQYRYNNGMGWPVPGCNKAPILFGVSVSP